MIINVLVVEDNIKLNKKICSLLETEEYTAHSFFGLEEARKGFDLIKPHIVLLDVMLPGGNGYELIKQFKTEYDCWVIMISALCDYEIKRISYESGADDYITKPFDMFELILKLKAIKKRVIANMKVFVIGDIILDEVASEIYKGNDRLKIPSSHSRFLRMLYEKHIVGSYMNKSELQFIDMNEFDDSNRIQTFVSRVRKSLRQINSENVLIETIYGKGYSMNILGREGMNNV